MELLSSVLVVFDILVKEVCFMKLERNQKCTNMPRDLDNYFPNRLNQFIKSRSWVLTAWCRYVACLVSADFGQSAIGAQLQC